MTKCVCRFFSYIKSTQFIKRTKILNTWLYPAWIYDVIGDKFSFPQTPVILGIDIIIPKLNGTVIFAFCQSWLLCTNSRTRTVFPNAGCMGGWARLQFVITWRICTPSVTWRPKPVLSRPHGVTHRRRLSGHHVKVKHFFISKLLYSTISSFFRLVYNSCLRS